MELNSISLWVILSVSIFLFFLGFFFRISIWLRGSDGAGNQREGKDRSRISRFFRYLGLFIKSIFSRRSGAIIKSFFADGMIHRNLFRDSVLKWFIHIFMFMGLAAFFIITVFHIIAIAAAPGGAALDSSCWFIRVFGTLENRFTAIVMDLSKLAILGGAFIAVLRFAFLKKRFKSVELKDKSAGVIISAIAVSSFFYEAAFFLSGSVPVERAAFAPAGFVLSHILSFIGVDWAIPAAVFFYIYIIALLLFTALIPYGKYSHMVFGPIVAVYNKLKALNQ